MEGRCTAVSIGRGLALALVGLVALASAVRAQETREYEIPDLDQPRGIADYVSWRLTGANRFVGDSDFGTFDALSFQPEGRLRIQVPLSERSLIRLQGTGRVLIYDFEGVSDLYGTGPTTEAPFSNLNSWNVRLFAAHLLPPSWTLFSDNESWALLAQATVKATYESGAELTSGLRGQGGIGFFYRLGNRFELGAGITLSSRLLRSGVGIGPFFEFDWKISEKWRLKNYGVGLQLERIFTDDFRVFARARFEGSSFRLDERPTVGAGVVRIRQLPAGLGLRWSITRHLRMTLIAGVMAYNQIRIRNEDRDTVGQATGDVSPYVTVRFDIR